VSEVVFGVGVLVLALSCDTSFIWKRLLNSVREAVDTVWSMLLVHLINEPGLVMLIAVLVGVSVSTYILLMI
jgi:hypothetical protein